MPPMKREVTEESAQHDEQLKPPNKRSKQDFGWSGFLVSPAQVYPLDELSPLGLRLRKSPSLLDLIQMRLSEGNASSNAGAKKDLKGMASSAATDKLKASNYPGLLLRIGTWEYSSRYEGDLVVKCYFAKHKLVWEVLDGGLKNKIEIQWSDIMALKATYPDDAPGTLDVVLTRQPLFFRETNPQPRKHTLWQATSDFTGGQASLHRRHYLQCPQGLLGKHFEKLIQCDPRLNFLSQQADVELESPYFESRRSVFDEPSESIEYNLNKERPAIVTFDFCGTSPSGGQSFSSRSEMHDPYSRHTVRETPSPSSVIDASATKVIRRADMNGLNVLNSWDQRLHSSISMSDLVNHFENQITKHKTSSNNMLSHEEQKSLEILENIRRSLFNDAQYKSSASDEKSIMSRVDSLCCLLQKDPATLMAETGFDESDPFTGFTTLMAERGFNESNPITGSVSGNKDSLVVKGETDDDKKAPGMPRNDSVGELLLNLPGIA